MRVRESEVPAPNATTCSDWAAALQAKTRSVGKRLTGGPELTQGVRRIAECPMSSGT
jgi:hypothetical protein